MIEFSATLLISGYHNDYVFDGSFSPVSINANVVNDYFTLLAISPSPFVLMCISFFLITHRIFFDKKVLMIRYTQ